MEERGYVLGNIDCTIIAQKPKLSPHKASPVDKRSVELHSAVQIQCLSVPCVATSMDGMNWLVMTDSRCCVTNQ
jgi:2C-methyl-D-erythritol 2,4-cyclodiphosphate synthase